MSREAGFLLQDQIRPRLISAIPNAVPLIAPEDIQELVQDGTAMAAQIIHHAELKGKLLVQSVNGKRCNLPGWWDLSPWSPARRYKPTSSPRTAV